MIPNFKGHHFVEDSKPGEPPSGHHCDRCGLKASLRPDGSTYFEVGRRRIFQVSNCTASPVTTTVSSAPTTWVLALITASTVSGYSASAIFLSLTAVWAESIASVEKGEVYLSSPSTW